MDEFDFKQSSKPTDEGNFNIDPSAFENIDHATDPILFSENQVVNLVTSIMRSPECINYVFPISSGQWVARV